MHGYHPRIIYPPGTRFLNVEYLPSNKLQGRVHYWILGKRKNKESMHCWMSNDTGYGDWIDPYIFTPVSYGGIWLIEFKEDLFTKLYLRLK